MVASYPGAYKSFTAKTDNVDVIYASHVNEIQDEVAAVQAELGLDPAGAFSTVVARLNDVDTTKYEAGNTILAAAGTAASPGLSFSADPNTGIFRWQEGTVSISGNGSNLADFTTAGSKISSANAYLWVDTQIRANYGAALSAPAYSFDADTDMGLTGDALGLRFVTASAERFRIADASSQFWNDVYLQSARLFVHSHVQAATPDLAWDGDPNTGFWKRSGDHLNISTAGIQRFEIASDGQMRLGNAAAVGAWGSQGTPAIVRYNDFNTGIYWPAADEITISTNSIWAQTWQASKSRLNVDLEPASNLIFDLGTSTYKFGTLWAENWRTGRQDDYHGGIVVRTGAAGSATTLTSGSWDLDFTMTLDSEQWTNWTIMAIVTFSTYNFTAGDRLEVSLQAPAGSYLNVGGATQKEAFYPREGVNRQTWTISGSRGSVTADPGYLRCSFSNVTANRGTIDNISAIVFCARTG